MRIRVGDCVTVRLAQDPKNTYLGAVTCLRPFGGKVAWESDTDTPLQVGMRLSFHADDERSVILPQDKIESVMSPEEWQSDFSAYEFVKGQHKSLLRLIEEHYGTLQAPWSENKDA